MEFKNGTYIHSTLEDGYDYFTTDKWGKEYHFRILTFPVPSGLESEAVQVIKKQKGIEPYIFQVLGEFEGDPEGLELLLKAKIQKSINKRYLKTENGIPVIGADQALVGRIDYNDSLTDTCFHRVFVIDGKRITVEQFAEMLQSVEGFTFKFSIYDPSDEIPE